jgi:hypothetical protein
VYVAFSPAYTPPGQDASPDPYRFSTQIDTAGSSSLPKLRFASLAHISFEKSRPHGVAEIVYYLQSLKMESLSCDAATRFTRMNPFRRKTAIRFYAKTSNR